MSALARTANACELLAAIRRMLPGLWEGGR